MSDTPTRTSSPLARRAAAGKAAIVGLATGSVGLAVVAFIVFKLIGW